MLILPAHARLEEHRRIHREGAKIDQILHEKSPLGELPDGQDRSPQREGRHDRINPGAVGQPGVDHRRRLVDATADSVHHAVDDSTVLLGIGEDDVAPLDLPLALDPELVERVAHDLGDAVVGEQRLERPVAERVLEHLLDEALALNRRDPDVLAFEDFVDGGADPCPQFTG